MIALVTEPLRIARATRTTSFAFVVSVALVSGFFGDANAATRIVPDAYPTIQAGINAATHGDTVLVRAGIYTGSGNRDIKYNGKRIVVRSEMGADATIIDCQGSPSEPHRGFNFSNGETNESVLDGFTIRDGYAGSAGGAIYIVSSPIIRNCIITDCSAPSGVVYSNYHEAIIEHCMIRNNVGMGISVSGYGIVANCTIINTGGIGGFDGTGIAAIELYGGEIRGCTIAGNSGTGILLEVGASIVRDCLITGNRGRAIDAWYAGSPLIEGCTIVGNDDPGRIGAVVLNYTGVMLLRRTIIRDNCGGDVFVYDDSYVRFECCAVDPSGVTGDGSISYIGPQVSQDPQFCSPIPCEDAPTTLGDFHLAVTSPCLPENSPCGAQIGALGSGCTPSAIPGDAPELTDSERVRIFPNPVLPDEMLMLSIQIGPESEREASAVIADGSPVQLVVFDSSGRERLRAMQTFQRDGMSLDPGSLEAGAYFVRVRLGGVEATGRFLKLR